MIVFTELLVQVFDHLEVVLTGLTADNLEKEEVENEFTKVVDPTVLTLEEIQVSLSDTGHNPIEVFLNTDLKGVNHEPLGVDLDHGMVVLMVVDALTTVSLMSLLLEKLLLENNI
nr:hypothetical protein HmN_000904800 [Hymenolepis microstoma]